jgi:hypothetical protein
MSCSKRDNIMELTRNADTKKLRVPSREKGDNIMKTENITEDLTSNAGTKKLCTSICKEGDKPENKKTEPTKNPIPHDLYRKITLELLSRHDPPKPDSPAAAALSSNDEGHASSDHTICRQNWTNQWSETLNFGFSATWMKSEPATCTNTISTDVQQQILARPLLLAQAQHMGSSLWRGTRGKVLLAVYVLLFCLTYIPIFFVASPPAVPGSRMPPGITSTGNQSAQKAGMTRDLVVIMDALDTTKEEVERMFLSRIYANNLSVTSMSINVDGVAVVTFKTTQTVEEVRSRLHPRGAVCNDSEAQVVEVLGIGPIEYGSIEDVESKHTWVTEKETAEETCTTKTGRFCHSNTTIRVRTLGRGGGEFERMSLRYGFCLRTGTDCNETDQREILVKREYDGNIIEACSDDIHSEDSKYVADHFSNVNRSFSAPCPSDTQNQMCEYRYEVNLSVSTRSSVLQLNTRNTTNKAHVYSAMNFEQVVDQYEVRPGLVEAEVQKFHFQCAEMRRRGNCVRMQHGEFISSRSMEPMQRNQDDPDMSLRSLLSFRTIIEKNRITKAEDAQQHEGDGATATRSETTKRDITLDIPPRVNLNSRKLHSRPLRRLTSTPHETLVKSSVSMEFNDEQMLAIVEDIALVQSRTKLNWPQTMMLKEGNLQQRLHWGLTRDPMLKATFKKPATISMHMEFSARVDFRHREKLCFLICITEGISAHLSFKGSATSIFNFGLTQNGVLQVLQTDLDFNPFTDVDFNTSISPVLGLVRALVKMFIFLTSFPLLCAFGAYSLLGGGLIGGLGSILAANGAAIVGDKVSYIRDQTAKIVNNMIMSEATNALNETTEGRRLMSEAGIRVVPKIGLNAVTAIYGALMILTGDLDPMIEDGLKNLGETLLHMAVLSGGQMLATEINTGLLSAQREAFAKRKITDDTDIAAHITRIGKPWGDGDKMNLRLAIAFFGPTAQDFPAVTTGMDMDSWLDLNPSPHDVALVISEDFLNGYLRYLWIDSVHETIDIRGGCIFAECRLNNVGLQVQPPQIAFENGMVRFRFEANFSFILNPLSDDENTLIKIRVDQKSLKISVRRNRVGIDVGPIDFSLTGNDGIEHRMQIDFQKETINLQNDNAKRFPMILASRLELKQTVEETVNNLLRPTLQGLKTGCGRLLPLPATSAFKELHIDMERKTGSFMLTNGFLRIAPEFIGGHYILSGCLSLRADPQVRKTKKVQCRAGMVLSAVGVWRSADTDRPDLPDDARCCEVEYVVAVAEALSVVEHVNKQMRHREDTCKDDLFDDRPPPAGLGRTQEIISGSWNHPPPSLSRDLLKMKGQCEDDSAITALDFSSRQEPRTSCARLINAYIDYDRCSFIKIETGGEMSPLNKWKSECDLGHLPVAFQSTLQVLVQVKCCLVRRAVGGCPSETADICSGHGRCLPHHDSVAACTCDPGFNGVACEKRCSLGAANLPCSGHGQCDQRDDGSVYCDCSGAWTGDSCDTPRCDFSCNHGSCIASDLCECRPGWAGRFCNQPEECSSTLGVQCMAYQVGLNGLCDPACYFSDCGDPDCDDKGDCPCSSHRLESEPCHPACRVPACGETACKDVCLAKHAGCKPYMRGNGLCDLECANEECDWDSDDCGRPKTVTANVLPKQDLCELEQFSQAAYEKDGEHFAKYGHFVRGTLKWFWKKTRAITIEADRWLELGRSGTTAIVYFRTYEYDYNAFTQIIVSFRGTTRPEDWVTDVIGLHPADCSLSGADDCGKVHSAWQNLAKALSGPIYEAILETAPEENNKVAIFMTGHSSGGALAQMVGYILCSNKKFDSMVCKNIEGIVAFGSPRWCSGETDKCFHAYSDLLGNRTTSVVAVCKDPSGFVITDVVPSTPPQYDKRHMGVHVPLLVPPPYDANDIACHSQYARAMAEPRCYLRPVKDEEENLVVNAHPGCGLGQYVVKNCTTDGKCSPSCAECKTPPADATFTDSKACEWRCHEGFFKDFSHEQLEESVCSACPKCDPGFCRRGCEGESTGACVACAVPLANATFFDECMWMCKPGFNISVTNKSSGVCKTCTMKLPKYSHWIGSEDVSRCEWECNALYNLTEDGTECVSIV